jgi:hypothetical protein
MNKWPHIILLFLLSSVNAVLANDVFFDYTMNSSSLLLNYTVNDAKELLKQANISITENENQANWKISLQLENADLANKTLYEANTKLTQQFTIQSALNDSNKHTILISSATEKGLSNGVYYFLQNKLGFQFYHPKETKIPDLTNFIE